MQMSQRVKMLISPVACLSKTKGMVSDSLNLPMNESMSTGVSYWCLVRRTHSGYEKLHLCFYIQITNIVKNPSFQADHSTLVMKRRGGSMKLVLDQKQSHWHSEN